MEHGRFVLVKGRFGMGGRIAVALSALRYSRDTGRQLIIDWNDYSYYSDAVEDVFRALWENPVISNVSISDLDGATVYPRDWAGKLNEYRNSLDAEIMPIALSMFHPPDRDDRAAAEAATADVVVVTRNDPEAAISHLYAELRPVASIRKRIAAFRDAHLGRQMIGVQIRHGNGERFLTPASTEWFHTQLEQRLSVTPEAGVFLATDSREVVDEFAATYDNLVHVPKWHPPIGSGSMHQHPGCPDRFQNGVEAITDMWLLKDCSQLLLCRGFFGATSRLLGRVPSESVALYPGKVHATGAEKVGWDNPI